MKDFNSVISSLSKGGLLSGLAGGLAGGTLISALSTKTGKKVGKTVVKAGAVAAIGGVAWKAYQAYSQRNGTQGDGHPTATAPAQAASHHHPAISAYQPTSASKPDQLAAPQEGNLALSWEDFDAAFSQPSADNNHLLLLKAMVAAAYADGHVDAQEKAHIFKHVEQMSLGDTDKQELLNELRQPATLDELAELVPNLEVGVEVYAASALAIDQSQPQSAQYLSQLSNKLEIPEELVAALNNEVSDTQAIRL